MIDGDFWENEELSKSYQSETISYTRACLGLSDDPSQTGNATINAFRTIGDALRQTYTKSTYPCLIDELD